jgi:hypothetical protein
MPKGQRPQGAAGVLWSGTCSVTARAGYLAGEDIAGMNTATASTPGKHAIVPVDSWWEEYESYRPAWPAFAKLELYRSQDRCREKDVTIPLIARRRRLGCRQQIKIE